MWPLITHYHRGLGTIRVIQILLWSWTENDLCSGNLLEDFRQTYQVKGFLWSWQKERRAASCVLWLLLLSSSVNECRGDLFVWGREQRGSLISTPFYLCPTAPASQPHVLSHAGVPQEAALHEGQRSEKGRKPIVLSFTTKLTNTQRCDC